jgi:uncharacterized protein (DUF1501 family)
MSTRRSFLRHLALATPAIGFGQSAATAPHTLVCVFLRGGADTLSLCAPYAQDGYYRARPTLSVTAPGKSGAGIRLDDHFCLHPAAAAFQPAYQEGRLSFIQGVGLDNTSGSHFDCQDQMEHGDSAHSSPAGGGWLGRYLRAMGTQQSATLSAVALGKTLPESLRGAPSVSVFERLTDLSLKTPTGKVDPALESLRAMYGSSVSLLGERGQQTLDLFKKVSALQQSAPKPANGADYGTGSFPNALREVAKLIRADVGLRVATVDLGGWDTHIVQASPTGGIADQFTTLSKSLAAFDLDLKDRRADYTVLIMTEFGRRIHENASLGTDHGRGFAMTLLSQRMKGGRVISPWPLLPETEEMDDGPGGLNVAHDYRSILTELLTGLMGLQQSEAVFPAFKPKDLGLI